MVLCAIAVCARAQEAPTIDLGSYDDPGMHFGAPADYTPLPRPSIDPANPPQLVVAAAWKKGDGHRQRTLLVALEPSDSALDAYVSSVQQELRAMSGSDSDNASGTFFADRKRVSTPNGMPAVLLHFEMGSDFNQREGYALIWVDGVRGVQVQLSAARGELSEAEAQAALQNVRGVLYPQAPK